jgi:hypothetical protein
MALILPVACPRWPDRVAGPASDLAYRLCRPARRDRTEDDRGFAPRPSRVTGRAVGDLPGPAPHNRCRPGLCAGTHTLRPSCREGWQFAMCHKRRSRHMSPGSAESRVFALRACPGRHRYCVRTNYAAASIVSRHASVLNRPRRSNSPAAASVRRWPCRRSSPRCAPPGWRRVS